ncbi:MAG: alpha-L-fucosidase [Bacteroidales bacterium]|nr:alpha-L-fucosidase [Bacteroidales bacterium]
MKNILILLIALFLNSSCNFLLKDEKGQEYKTYDPTWESLSSHEIPEWLIDAKFGIYAHWGVYSVPSFKTEWYAKRMYVPGNSVFEHHKETYGDQSEFGFKDFVPMFKAENYDPDEWAEIIKSSGAKYAGLATVHHDGFCLWDSEYTRWNAMDMGPERDLYGELTQALRKKDMKVIATFHHIRTFDWYLPYNTDFYVENDTILRNEFLEKDWDIFDPEFGDLYWNEAVGRKKEDFIVEWRNKVTEVMDKYQPDLVWFDGGTFQDEKSEADVRSLLAYYLNKEKEWSKPLEVLNKFPMSMKFNFPESFGMQTYEEGRDRDANLDNPWIDDMKISDTAWCYIEGQTYKTANEIIDGLIDRVSRGGGLLLNLSPKADGTIPHAQKKVLAEIGDWLDKNGEAIFDTRPWEVHAEGPTEKLRTPDQHSRWIFKDNCDGNDIRFTKKGNILYVISLGWPENGVIRISSLSDCNILTDNQIIKVSMPGFEEDVLWTEDTDLFLFELPKKTNDFAFVVKIEFEKEL